MELGQVDGHQRRRPVRPSFPEETEGPLPQTTGVLEAVVGVAQPADLDHGAWIVAGLGCGQEVIEPVEGWGRSR